MIIIGYQGIGKTTLSKNNKSYLDLESSTFFVNGLRQDNWYKIYVNQAIALSNQGYDVFVSSHDVVRKELELYPNDIKVVSIVPSINLKDLWIEKLNERYNQSQLAKDLKALKNAQCRYSENIQEIMASPFDCIIIDRMDYNLEILIKAYINYNNDIDISSNIFGISKDGREFIIKSDFEVYGGMNSDKLNDTIIYGSEEDEVSGGE